MYTVAAAHGTDVVLGKVISDFRGVNHRIYREDRPTCTVHDAPLMESLTPHKMFRTQFLRDHGIRYPEGPRRLEDQLFMAKAYFEAECCHGRRRPGVLSLPAPPRRWQRGLPTLRPGGLLRQPPRGP